MDVIKNMLLANEMINRQTESVMKGIVFPLGNGEQKQQRDSGGASPPDPMSLKSEPAILA